MAEQSTASAAPAAASEAAPSETTTHEAAGTESAVELRDALVAKLKENRAAREAEDGNKPEKPAKKPKDAQRDAKPDKDKPAAPDDDAASDDDSPEQAAFKAERRKFAKARRKFEANANARENQLRQFETNAQRETELFTKDPIGWLKARGKDVRQVLLGMVKEDGEDPRDKKLRELEAEQKADKAERQREKEERAAREAKVNQREAVKAIEAELGKAWQSAEVDEYPTVAVALEPAHVAQRAAEIMVEDYSAWVKAGNDPRRYKELAPIEIFQKMEEELAPLKGKLATGKKSPKPPEQVRAASGTRKAATPEAPTKRERPSSDVTRSTTREPTLGRPLNFDKDEVKERLKERVRALRS